MPQTSYIFKSQKKTKGFKAAKYHVTLLLTINASGTCHIKPLVVYRSRKPRAYSNQDMNRLNVYWMSNKKAWMSGPLCLQWFDKHLVPDLQALCRSINLAFKILFLLDNAPGHSPLLVDRHPNVKVIFMPPNATSLLQPLDQEIIANFKIGYVMKTFDMLDKATDPSSDLSDIILNEDEPCQPVEQIPLPGPNVPQPVAGHSSDDEEPAAPPQVP